MAKTATILTTEADLDRLVAEDKANPFNRLVKARYSSSRDLVVLTFANGVETRIPRHLLQGLADAERYAPSLSEIEVYEPGHGVGWPALNISFSVEGLLGGVYGTAKWMTASQSRAGSTKTPAKSAAARANGAKGGRPRKTAA